MKTTDEEYFRSCVAKERQLAKLLGHRNIEECYESAGVLWDNTVALPQWTRDWNACGPLLSHFAISLDFSGGEGTVKAGDVLVRFADHPNRERAIMCGVVKAVIHKLEHDAVLAHPVGA